jgi:acid phosphatase
MQKPLLLRSVRNLVLFFCLLQLLTAFSLAQVPRSNHVWLITEENHSYENAVAAMPYLMSVGRQYGIAIQSYSDMHNSIATLMHLVAGTTVTTNNTTTAFFSNDNIVRHLLLQGLTWKAYQESLPYVGFLGVSSYPYVRRHDPLAYFTDVNTPVQSLNIVPYPADITNDLAGNYNYVTPNLLDDAHDGTMAAADSWLQSHLPAILARPEFQPGGDGLMIITFDEGNLSTDNRCSATVSTGCGGRILTIVVGPRVKRGFQSNVWHNHESVLKTTCLALGLSTCPGAAQTANDLGEFFASAGAVTVTSPTASATTSPVHVVASATSASAPISAMKIYLDNRDMYTIHAASLDTQLPVAAGVHNLVAQAWDSTGAVFKTSRSVSVNGVNIVAPLNGASTGQQVQCIANAYSAAGITAMRIYVDNVSRYFIAASSLNTTLTLTSGAHNVVIQAWDKSGAVLKSSAKITVN